MTALSGRVDLGARRVLGETRQYTSPAFPAPSDVSEFERVVVSRRLHAARSLVATGRERWV